MTNTDVWALATDPWASSVKYAGTRGGGVFRSDNDGANWYNAGRGLTNSNVWALLAHPALRGTIYAGTDGGVSKTTDAGANWSSLGLSGMSIRALVFDAETATLYAGAVGQGVYKIVQGAETPTAFATSTPTLSRTPTATASATLTSSATSSPTVAATRTPTPTSSPTAPAASIAVDPAGSVVGLGESCTIGVVARGVADLGGFEYTLRFDPAVVQVEGVALGAFLGSTGRMVSAIGPVIDNQTGAVTFGAFSFGSAAGPSGTGTLANLTFRAVATGSTALTFGQVQLTDTHAAIIPIGAATGGTVTVLPVTETLTPTPSGTPTATPSSTPARQALFLPLIRR